MATLEKIIFASIRHVVANEADYDFPAFITALIAASSIRPWHVAMHTGLKQRRLFNFQNKKYYRVPTEDEMKLIAEYFSVPQDLLARKVHEYEGTK